MGTSHHNLAVLVGLGAALLAPGCFAVANLDRFDFDPGACAGTASDTRDYSWSVTDLVPHQGQLFEMKVVDTADGRVAAAIVYDPIPSGEPASLQGTLTDALAPGSYEAQFWADLSTNRSFDPGGVDHAWAQPVPDGGCFSFAHHGPFDATIAPIDDPSKGDVTLRFTGVGTFAGEAFIFRVRDQNGAEVGFYRLDAIAATPSAAPLMTLFDLAVSDTTYELQGFVDLDRDGRITVGEPVFDPPPMGASPSARFELDLGAP
jgi:hypothetical protein